VETDLLLALLAVRLQGGRSVPAKSDALKSFKTSIAKAKSRNYLREQTIKVSVTNKTGKLTKKAMAVLDLTEEGERFLEQQAGPEAVAATTTAHLTAIRQDLEADRQTLRSEVLAALSSKGKEKGEGSAKALSALSKAVAGLAEKLQKLEAGLQQGDEAKILSHIDQAFAALTAKLTGAVPVVSSQTKPLKGTAAPEQSQPTTQESLNLVLQKAYKELCHFVEFKDGLVEIPRLHHEARRAMQGLTIDAVHRALEALWKDREIELHIANDPGDVPEPDKGIRRDNKLYYYVFWRNP